MQSDENRKKLEQMFRGKEFFDEENNCEMRRITGVCWDGTQFLVKSVISSEKYSQQRSYCINYTLPDMIEQAVKRKEIISDIERIVQV